MEVLPDILPEDPAALRVALLAERTARLEAEQKLSGAAATIAHLELMIAKLRQDKFGASSERSKKLLDQMELQLEELQATQSEEVSASEIARPAPASRRKPVRGPLPEHLPRERVVIAAPGACPCCGGTRLAKLGESVTETLEVIPRQWKVVQTVREKFSCAIARPSPSRRRHSIPLPEAAPGRTCWPPSWSRNSANICRSTD